MKKLIITLVTIVFIFTSTLTVTNAAPDTNSSKVQLVEVSDKLKNLNAEVEKTNSEINELEKIIETNNASIEEQKNQIESAQIKIESLNKEIEENEKLLSSRLREMYKHNGFSSISYISFIFESDSLSDLIDRVTACNVIIKEDNKLISNLNKQVSQENETKDLITSKKQALESFNNENKEKLEEVNSKKVAQLEAKKQLEEEKANLLETIKSNELALINNDINTINTSANYNSINKAIKNIKDILPQLTIQSVINTANDAISNGESKLSTLSNNSKDDNISDNVIATYTMEATAYTSSSNALTATGLKPVYNPSGISTIAVDPSVIPLGSKVYVEGYGYAIASDTGGAIKGMIIDVYLNSEEACTNWGRRNVTVKVLG